MQITTVLHQTIRPDIKKVLKHDGCFLLFFVMVEKFKLKVSLRLPLEMPGPKFPIENIRNFITSMTDGNIKSFFSMMDTLGFNVS